MRPCPACQQQVKEQMRFCPFCGSSLPEPELDKQLGAVLDGKYRIERKIGESGFGTLYNAADLLNKSSAVVELVQPDLFNAQSALKPLRDCVGSTRAISHPNIAAVREFSDHNGAPYLVLESFDGKSLRELIKERRLEYVEVESIIGQIGSALQWAHENGVFHGALTPESIWLVKSGDGGEQVKVIDLGLSALIVPFVVNQPAKWNVRAITILSYLSPEQFGGKEGDARSDVYSLGIIAYELLAARVPFQAGSAVDLAMKHINELPEPLRSARSDTPVKLDATIMRALQKDPSNRQASVGRFAEEVERALRDWTVGHENRATTGAFLTDAAELTPPVEAHPEAPPGELRDPDLYNKRGQITDFNEPLYLDENVQFTVYRPTTVQPLVWSTLLAFAHLSERRPGADDREADPLEEVQRQARQVLGERVEDYQKIVQDSSQAVPREGELTFMPTAPGVEFNPPSRSFLWQESVHREEFRLRASPSLDGQTARGRLSVFLGSILLAEVTLSIRVDSRQEAEGSSLEPASARCYRKIFASYSHRDAAIVEQFERFAQVFGDQYLRDVTHLRAGEVWNDSLERMISEADIFQLFWSTNSMRSEFVRREWEYALMLGRKNFVRPTYWEDPLPAAPESNLPPEELARLHFQRITASFIAQPTADARKTPGDDSPPSWSRPTRPTPVVGAPLAQSWSPPSRANEITGELSAPSGAKEPPTSSGSSGEGRPYYPDRRDSLEPPGSPGSQQRPRPQGPPTAGLPPPTSFPFPQGRFAEDYIGGSQRGTVSAPSQPVPTTIPNAPYQQTHGRPANPLLIVFLVAAVLIMAAVIALGVIFVLRLI